MSDKAKMGQLKKFYTNQNEFVATLSFPIEDAEQLHQFFGGHIQPGDERWFAIAPINEEMAKAFSLEKRIRKRPELDSDGNKAVRGSAALCKEEPFWRFLRDVMGEGSALDEESALDVVRRITNVKSRAEFRNDPIARDSWFRLSSAYHKWASEPEDSPNA